MVTYSMAQLLNMQGMEIASAGNRGGEYHTVPPRGVSGRMGPRGGTIHLPRAGRPDAVLRIQPSTRGHVRDGSTIVPEMRDAPILPSTAFSPHVRHAGVTENVCALRHRDPVERGICHARHQLAVQQNVPVHEIETLRASRVDYDHSNLDCPQMYPPGEAPVIALPTQAVQIMLKHGDTEYDYRGSLQDTDRPTMRLCVVVEKDK